MYPIYLSALVLGLGTLVLQSVLSALGGGADAGHDIDGDFLGDVGADGAEDAAAAAAAHEGLSGTDGSGDAPVHAAVGAASLVISVRFWTFAIMAFGMVGTLLNLFGTSGFGTTLLISIAVGLASGFAASYTFRALRGAVSSTASQEDTVGKVAAVTVPVLNGSVGSIRLVLKGKRVDMLAITDSSDIEKGEEVVVVEFRGEHALVERVPLSDR